MGAAFPTIGLPVSIIFFDRELVAHTILTSRETLQLIWTPKKHVLVISDR